MGKREVIRSETIEATETLRAERVHYPDGVDECHKEILRLKSVIFSTREIVSERDDQIDSLQREVDEAQEESDKAQAIADEEAISAINDLLDDCERVGPLRYAVPATSRTERALVKLHDIARRAP